MADRLPPMLRLLILSLTAVVAACALPASNRPHEQPAYRTVPVGTTLILKKEITIPAERYGRFFQGGQPVMSKDVDQYHANCKLMVEHSSDTGQTVPPGSFIIRRIQLEEFVQSRPVKLAAVGFGIGIGTGVGLGVGDGSPGMGPYTTIFYLYSEKQPQVKRLICSHWEEAYDAEHLTVTQIRKALGDYFDLVVK